MPITTTEGDFANAAQNNWILFFDEADALFGKRTKVKDSNDKYANIEVPNLIQKMDQHRGLMVLSSNSESEIDPAFLAHLHRINSIGEQRNQSDKNFLTNFLQSLLNLFKKKAYITFSEVDGSPA